MAGWPRRPRPRLLYRRGVPTRSARELVTLVSKRLGLPGIVLLAAGLCDLMIIAASASDSAGPVGQDLWLLPGVVAFSACAVWARRRPLQAGLTGAAVLLLSSGLISATGTVSYTALLADITFAETVAGVELVYYAVLTLPPLTATVATAALVFATVTATVVRAQMWVHGSPFPETTFAGFVLLLLTVFAGAYQRRPRRRRRERSTFTATFTTLMRQQWPLVSVLVTVLFLETFYAASAHGFGFLVLLCSFGTAVVALLASRIPVWAAVYYSAFVIMSGSVFWFTGALHTYAELYGMPFSQIVSGMAVVVVVVRHETPTRAAGLIALQSVAVALVTGANTPNFPSLRVMFVAALLLLGICVALGMFLRARDSERAHAVATAVSDAQTAERMALARELHDVVAHHVTGIVVQAQAARMLAEQNPAVVVDALGQIERAGTDAMTAMRRLVRSMRGDAPAGASEFSEQATTDLAADLRRLVDTGNHGVPTELAVDVPDELPPEVARSALRLVQESLTNVGKHAEGASKAVVTVGTVGDELHIRIADDGTGSAEQTRATRPSEDSGYGLVGMRERVDLLRGRLSAGPSPEGGWLVEAALPLIPLTGEAGRKDGE